MRIFFPVAVSWAEAIGGGSDLPSERWPERQLGYPALSAEYYRGVSGIDPCGNAAGNRD